MLSRRPNSLQIGHDPRTTAASRQLSAFPLYPQYFATGIAAPFALDILSLGIPSSPHRSDNLLDRTTKSQSEHVESSSHSYSLYLSTEVARRRMKPTPFKNTKSIPVQHINFTFPSHEATQTAFTFESLPRPEMALSFPPRPSPPRPKKRSRAAADVDGEHSSLHKKKRRLRLFLITSRLSPQYSHPATNIVDRGSSKIAVWAKQKSLGRNLMRKAAILNRIRRQAFYARETEGGLKKVLVEQEKEQEQLRLAKLAFVYGSHDTHTRPVVQRGSSFPPGVAVRNGNHFEISGASPTESPSGSPSPSPPLRGRDDDSVGEYRSPNDAYSYSPPRSRSPRRSYLPLPPSPLGLSNYDAFDLEDDIPDPYAHLDEEYDAFEQDEDVSEDTPAPAAAPSRSRPSTPRRDSSDRTETPPESFYSDFSILDPDEPVIGDYDQTEDGADGVWPSAFIPEAEEATRPLSSSPDFPALFATAQPGIEIAPLSPNFTAAPPASPLSPTSTSPNFTKLPIIGDELRSMREHAAPRAQPPDVAVRKDIDIEQERERQKKFMFMQFGS